MKKVSILVPCHNEQLTLPYLVEALRRLMDENPEYEWEALLVNDGSNDSSLELMRDFHKADPRISYLDLSRKYGKEIAIVAGMDFVSGDCVVIMDADLQHPTNAIPDMIAKWEEGYDDVYGRRIVGGESSRLRKKLSKIYYRLLQRTTKIDILPNVGDFRLLDRRCIEAFKKLRESERNNKALFSWIGYKKIGVPYVEEARVAGKSSWNLTSLAKLAIDGIVSFTTAPLKLSFWLGGLFSIISIVILLWNCIAALFFGKVFSTVGLLSGLILLVGGCILLCLGIIGMYLSRMFVESKNRPTYLAREYKGNLL